MNETLNLKRPRPSSNVRRKKAIAADNNDTQEICKIHKPNRSKRGSSIHQLSSRDQQESSRYEEQQGYSSERRVIPSGSSDFLATAIDSTIEISPEILKEKASLRADEQREAVKAVKEATGIKSYTGMLGQRIKVEKRETFKKGPTKAPLNIRISTLIDYHPSLCKDYKETGFCGYGDNCKFLHDRGDYKSGWEVDKEYEEEQRKNQRRKMGLEVEEEEDYQIESEDENDEFPIACRGPFQDPVVTKCNHFFCSDCARKRYSTNTKCACCNEQTQGIFNIAKNLIKVISEREAKEKLKQDKDKD